MKAIRTIHDITLLVEAYLAKSVRGIDLVKGVDDFVANDCSNKLCASIQNLISDFQDDLSLYVDEETRKEAPETYICDKELFEKASVFNDKLKHLISNV